ncbi:MAG TPA: SEC-C metal-binding domain-containing protein [Nitrospiria bacterium]|jgi:tetratricopeptide (TPR) repeat protein
MDQISVDKFITVLDEALKRFERPGRRDRSGYKKTLEEQYLLAKRVYEFILKADGTPDKDLFDEIVQKAEFDFTGWLVGLPLSLNDHGGLIDEAVEVGSLFAEIHSPDNFLGDMGIILAEAGRREEALKRITENLERFDDDVWVMIKSGDAFCALKETERAIELYNRAYALRDPLSYDREGVLERLIPLLRELGRDEEADSLAKREEKAREEEYKSFDTDPSVTKTPVEPKRMPAKSLKVGRNQPCPCGSGKKYKKCCWI